MLVGVLPPWQLFRILEAGQYAWLGAVPRLVWVATVSATLFLCLYFLLLFYSLSDFRKIRHSGGEQNQQLNCL
jgi:hypothetical protein